MKLLVAASLALFTSICHAQTFGSWTVGLDDSGAPYMVATNDSGNYLGKWCTATDKSCYWLIAAQNRCDSGTSADVLISSVQGVRSNTTICTGPTDVVAGVNLFRNALTDPDGIDKIVQKSSTFSVVMALTGDNFKVMRFPMNGAPEALSRWRSLVSAWLKTLPPSTKDTVL